MPDRQLLSTAKDVVVNPRRGRIAWASHVNNTMVFRQRPKHLKASFDDLFIHRIGPANLLRTGKGPSALIGPHHQPLFGHSLVFELKHNAEAAEAQVIKLTSDALADSIMPEIRVDGPVFSVCNEGAATWGHWIGHNLPRAMLFLHHVPHGRIIVPAAYIAQSTTFAELLFRAGITPSQIVAAPHRCWMRLDDCVLIDLPYSNGVFHPILAEQIKLLKPNGSNDSARRKYVPRGSSDRKITNADEIEAIHKEFQIESAGINLTSLESQITAWTNCSMMLAIMGSDLTNMAIGRPEAVCSITPHWFGDIFFYGLSSILGIEWNKYYCGTKDVYRDPEHRSSFRVNSDDYRTFLDWCLAQ